jgi:D-amino-acid dehydrogenase
VTYNKASVTAGDPSLSLVPIPDLLVVGGGIAGATLAWHAVSAGARVTLVDQHHVGRATDAGAGILSPETSGNPLDAWFDLVLACGHHYPELVASLDDDTGYDQCGLLAVALADWDIDPYMAVADLALARAARSGADIRPMTAEDAAARFPVGAPVTRALWHPAAARVDGRLLTAALLAGAVRRGLTIIDGAVRTIATTDGRVTTVNTDDGEVGCGALAIAGGAWSPSLGQQLGVQLPIRPERGQIIHLAVDDPDTGTWPIIQPAFGFYVVSWPGGRVVVGATREGRSGFDARPTVAGVRQLVDEVVRVAPGLADAAIAEVRVGLRPVSGDDLPILGPVPRVTNAFVATGYGANGLLLAPWCAKLVADAALGRSATDTLQPFLASRFNA